MQHHRIYFWHIANVYETKKFTFQWRMESYQMFARVTPLSISFMLNYGISQTIKTWRWKWKCLPSRYNIFSVSFSVKYLISSKLLISIAFHCIWVNRSKVQLMRFTLWGLHANIFSGMHWKELHMYSESAE